MADVEEIIRSVKNKKKDYRHYDFSVEEGDALKTFFDLAQEFDDIDDLYVVCVSVLKVFLNLQAKLYLIDPKTTEFTLVSKTEESGKGLYVQPPPEIVPKEKPYRINNSLILTIKGKKILSEQLPNTHKNNVLGILDVYPAEGLKPDDEFFLEKYANRIGYNIHNKLLLNKNIEHLKFIKNLVADIEHNIIVPNMIFKLFIRRLKGKILKNMEIEKLLIMLNSSEDECDGICIVRLMD
jgi:hypothetical protein